MSSIEVDCSVLNELIGERQIITANYLVTDPERLFQLTEEVDSRPTRKMIKSLQQRFEDFEISREEDYFEVRNRGALEGLVQTRLKYECEKENGLIHLAAFIMKTLAENQVFGDGNKRTAYLTGTMFLVKYQIQVMERPEAVIPELDDEMVTLLQELAVGEAELYELKEFLSTVEEDVVSY